MLITTHSLQGCRLHLQESADWTRNKCSLSALTSVRIKRLSLKGGSTVLTTANLPALDLASLRKPTRLQALVSPAGSETRAEKDIVAG